MKVKNIIMFGLFALLSMSCATVDKEKVDLKKDKTVSLAVERTAARL